MTLNSFRCSRRRSARKPPAQPLIPIPALSERYGLVCSNSEGSGCQWSTWECSRFGRFISCGGVGNRWRKCELFVGEK